MTRTVGEGAKKNSSEWVKTTNENGRVVYIKAHKDVQAATAHRMDRDLSDETSYYYNTHVRNNANSDMEIIDRIADFSMIDPPYTQSKPFSEIKHESYNYIADAYSTMEKLKENQDAAGLFRLYQDVALSEQYADMISSGFQKDAWKDKEYKDLFLDYRAFLAETIDYTYKINGGSNIVPEYTGDTLGQMHPVAQYKSGTREWLESRQKGMGASDINAIINTNSKYSAKNIVRVFKSKVEPISEEEVMFQDENNRDYRNTMNRGTVMEDFIADVSIMSTPSQYEFLHDKRTWSGGHSDIVRINYDYMFDSNLGDNKHVDGTLEIKTASNFRGWGKDLESIDSVSKSYRPQLLVQARMADMDYASIGVMVNERDHRLYQIKMTDELRQEADEYIAAAEKFYNDCQEYKRTGVKPDIVIEAERQLEEQRRKWEERNKNNNQ